MYMDKRYISEGPKFNNYNKLYTAYNIGIDRQHLSFTVVKYVNIPPPG